MESHAGAPEPLVDLGRYPVLDPGSANYRSVVEEGRAQMAATGAVELTGFVTPDGVAELVADAESLAPRAHRSGGGKGTAYLEIPDFSLPDGHPRLAAQAGVASGVLGAVADDVITAADADDLLLIAAVWVDPRTAVEALVYENNRHATRQALEQGRLRQAALDALLAVAQTPENPFSGLKLE